MKGEQYSPFLVQEASSCWSVGFITHSLSTTTNQRFTLYAQDYYLWLETTAQLLRAGQLSAIDAANLLEEIEDIGRSEKRAVYSNFKILLMYLLKHWYQPDKHLNS